MASMTKRRGPKRVELDATQQQLLNEAVAASNGMHDARLRAGAALVAAVLGGVPKIHLADALDVTERSVYKRIETYRAETQESAAGQG